LAAALQTKRRPGSQYAANMEHLRALKQPSPHIDDAFIPPIDNASQLILFLVLKVLRPAECKSLPVAANGPLT
jgi:hypothetical protein